MPRNSRRRNAGTPFRAWIEGRGATRAARQGDGRTGVVLVGQSYAGDLVLRMYADAEGVERFRLSLHMHADGNAIGRELGVLVDGARVNVLPDGRVVNASPDGRFRPSPESGRRAGSWQSGTLAGVHVATDSNGPALAQIRRARR